MKTIRLLLTLISLGALLGAASPAAGEVKPPSGDGHAKSDHHPANQAPPTAGIVPASGVTVSDALAVELQPKHNGIHDWKKQLQTRQALIIKKQSTALNTTKAKVPSKSSLSTAPHTKAKPWSLAKTTTTPWGVFKTATPHGLVTTGTKEITPATPWSLPKTANPHEAVLTVPKEPKPELKTSEIESLPTQPIGLPANGAFITRTISIDRQHSPGLVALGGPKYPSLAHNSVALNGTGMKHKPY